MSQSPFSLQGAWKRFDRFFFEPRETHICAIIRIAFSVLVLVNALVLLPDLTMWFGEDGILPEVVADTFSTLHTWTIFQWLPRTHAVLFACYGLFVAQAALLAVGFMPRLQAAGVFVWLVSFQYRNPLLLDGEDAVFRMLAFLLILLPSADHYAVSAWWRRRKGWRPEPSVAWGLRLVQIQVCVIYTSTVWEKMKGADWYSGDALYYVVRLDDLFGRFPLPRGPLESLPLMRLATWGILVVEATLPVALWFRETRRGALYFGILFHLSIDYAMNLFLFQWMMIVSLLAFAERGDLRWVLDRTRFLRRILPGTTIAVQHPTR